MHESSDARAPGRFRPREPRVALLVMALWVAASLTTIRDPRSMAVAVLFVSAWHALATGRVAATGRTLVRLLPFAVTIVALNAVLVPGETLFEVGGRRVISREGLEDGVFFALRLAVMLVSVAAFLATAEPEAMARAAHDVVRRFSARAAAQVALFVFLSMGFVPLVAEEFHRIRVAQSFRGGDFSGGIRRRADAARAWLVPLLVSTIHRSGQLAMAVELRDIRARLPHTIEAPRLGAADALLAVAALSAAVLASR